MSLSNRLSSWSSNQVQRRPIEPFASWRKQKKENTCSVLQLRRLHLFGGTPGCQRSKITGVTVLLFLLSPNLYNFSKQNNVRAREVEEVETVRPEVSAFGAGTRRKGCGWTPLNEVHLVSALSPKLFWHHPCVHPHPEKRRGKKTGSLTNPAFPRDRGDIQRATL